MDNRAIGIFDSGIGGLTVTKEIIKLLPYESIIYLGDTARVPYGIRSKHEVISFAKQLIKFLLKRKVKILVVACNTISALALDEIRKISPVPLVEVIRPAVRKAIATTKNKKIGLIGTLGTIQSRVYETEIKKLDPQINLTSVGCPLFVPLAEGGLHQHEVTKIVAEDYLDEIKDANVDTLILGCTHYPLLLDAISQAVGPDVSLVDSAEPTAYELKKVLQEKNLLADNSNPRYEFFVTSDPQKVYKVVSKFFGEKLNGRLKNIILPTL